MKPRIVIPDDAPAVMGPSAAYGRLLEWADVTYHSTLPGGDETLVERISGFPFVLNIRSSSKFTRDVLSRAPGLKLLSLWGTGTDNVDLQAASELGITVTNTPGVAAIAIAEHCLALLLAVTRRLLEIDPATRRGEWPRGQVSQIHGKTLGVIGLGAIGRQFAKIAAGVGMKVNSWTLHPKPELGIPHVELDELYRTSDVVSVHLRLSAQTERFVGPREFSLMKKGAIFLNTARGPIVDEVALIEALRRGHLAGAGLDVFEKEPLAAGHEISQLPNVVLTPHSAGVTPETLEAGLELSIANIRNFLEGRPANVVAGGKVELQ